MRDFLTDMEAAIPGLRRYALAVARVADARDALVQDYLERANTMPIMAANWNREVLAVHDLPQSIHQ